ncbi:MAG: hypothetical protein Q8R02_03890 [Hyphomonadaceae bacterium]|nr:hypothetical protein [Hyphomonadaceae bacterium]
MNPLTARWVYCAGLFFVTACAVLPETLVAPAPAVVAVAPPTPEQQLAHAMRDRIELQRNYGKAHPAIATAAAAEDTLRDFALSANPEHFHRDLLRALTNELSDALADRTAASLKYAAKHPEHQKADLAVSGLMAAINVEMRKRDV